MKTQTFYVTSAVALLVLALVICFVPIQIPGVPSWIWVAITIGLALLFRRESTIVDPQEEMFD